MLTRDKNAWYTNVLLACTFVAFFNKLYCVYVVAPGAIHVSFTFTESEIPVHCSLAGNHMLTAAGNSAGTVIAVKSL